MVFRHFARLLGRLVPLFGLLAASLPAMADDLSPPDSLVKPVTDLSAWFLVSMEGAAGQAVADSGGIRTDVTALGPHPWDALFQGSCDLKEGQSYTLRFLAKADAPRALTVTGVIDMPDYHIFGLSQTAMLTTQWKPCSMTFTATKTFPGHNAIQFQVGSKVGSVWLSDVSVVPAEAAASPAGAAPDPPFLQPRRGEVRLEGIVQKVLPHSHSLLILAALAVDPGHDPHRLVPARAKVIAVRPVTLLLPKNDTKSHTSENDFQPGDTVVVVGVSQGDGKPLVARVVAAVAAAPK